MTDPKHDGSQPLAEMLFCGFLLVLLIVFFVAATGYPAITRRAPLVVMIPVFLMVLGQTAVTVLKCRRIRKAGGPPEAFFSAAERKNLKKGVQVLIWLILLLLSIYLAGHLGGIALFLLVFLKWMSGESWKITIGVSAGVTACMYLLFERILMISLYRGFVYETIMDWLWA